MPGCVVWSLVCATFSAAHFCGDPFSAGMIKERLPCDLVAGKLFVWRYLHCRCIFLSPNSVKNVRHATCVSAHPTMPSTNDLVLREKCSQCTCSSVARWSLLFFPSRNTTTTALPTVAYYCLVVSLWPTNKDILQAITATACILERLWSTSSSPVSSRQNKSIFMCVPGMNCEEVWVRERVPYVWGQNNRANNWHDEWNLLFRREWRVLATLYQVPYC